jgi:hypothetical protein
MCPELPRSPSLAYEVLQSRPWDPGIRQQSNIHLQTVHPVSVKIFCKEKRMCVPISVHTVRSFFIAIRFDQALL